MRRLAFALLVAVLMLAALVLGSRHEAARPSAAETPAAIHAPRGLAPRTIAPAVLPSARRFVSAFLAYESGEQDRDTRAAIRRGASRSLAREVLAAPSAHSPHAEGGRPPAPTLTARRLPRRPRLVLVTGEADRAPAPEPIAFLFALRAGRWLAVAPAE